MAVGPVVTSREDPQNFQQVLAPSSAVILMEGFAGLSRGSNAAGVGQQHHPHGEVCPEAHVHSGLSCCGRQWEALCRINLQAEGFL